jgi:hypothetical protein
MKTMRKHAISTPRAASALALALALLIMMAGAAAAQDSGDWYDTKIFRKVLRGIGLRNGDEDNIEYRERSPLVVPPSRALPPPQSQAAYGRDPAWPKDPDVARARARKKKANEPSVPLEEQGRPLTPRELEKGRISGGGRKSATAGKGGPDFIQRLLPSQLGYKGGLFAGSLFGYKEEVVPFKGEPPRDSLLDPPSGYRTPSPAQPYGILSKKNEEKAENNYITRGEVK